MGLVKLVHPDLLCRRCRAHRPHCHHHHPLRLLLQEGLLLVLQELRGGKGFFLSFFSFLLPK